MKKIIIEPHYLGSIEYYSLLTQYNEVILEINDVFPKQTFRNRCYILGSNKVLPLIIPVRSKQKMLTKDVTIDYSQRWIKDHWGAFYSSYGKAPFFEFFADQFDDLWRKKSKYLIELNFNFIKLTLKILGVSVNLTYSEYREFDSENNWTNSILPKKAYTDRKIYQSTPYTQLFGDTFVPNLSVVDLIMCEGPVSSQILSASFLSA